MGRGGSVKWKGTDPDDTLLGGITVQKRLLL